jgi:PAS domain S-box-containing protein
MVKADPEPGEEEARLRLHSPTRRGGPPGISSERAYAPGPEAVTGPLTEGLVDLGLDASQLRRLTEHSPDVIMVLDLECRIRFINWTAPGLTVESVLGTAVFDYVPADQHPEMRACFEEVRRTSSPGSYRNVYQLHDGTRLRWESRVAPVTRDGRLVGFTVFSRDVSERDTRVKELAEFFELSLEFLTIATPQGYFTRVNPAFTRVLGYEEEELLSRPYLEFVHPEDLEITRAAMTRLAAGIDVVGFENRYRTHTGHYRLLAWQARADPARQRILAAARDVTEGRALEAQLRESQKMDAIGKLAGGIAHDFNNLILVLLANSDFATRELQPEQTQVRGYLEEIERAAHRAASLTRQLLAFSRREPLLAGPVDLNALCQNLLNMLRRLIPENISIEFSPGTDLPLVEGDRGQLEQVLMNLCVNARDAMPGGGRMTIGTEAVVVGGGGAPAQAPSLARPGHYAVLTVTDTGQGMTKEIKERLFEPFFTTKESGKGTGLGLSTAYAIVKRHGGHIQVDSKPGTGAIFRSYFPASDGDLEARSETTDVEMPGGNEIILVVEDEEQVRRLVVQILERAGYRVLVAADGLQAVALVRSQNVTVDLAVLDVVMPGLGGPETYTELLKHQANLAVLFSSGYADSSRFASRIPAGHTLLRKPYAREELLERVRAALDETHRRRA